MSKNPEPNQPKQPEQPAASGEEAEKKKAPEPTIDEKLAQAKDISVDTNFIEAKDTDQSGAPEQK